LQHQATQAARKNAKSLRADMTDAERRIWSRLRREQLGCRFRRQHPLGGYVADFACLDLRLIIEIDGSQHMDHASYDERRTAWLVQHGFRVLRFWSNDALSQTDAVVEQIFAVVRELRSSAPSLTLPQRGREEYLEPEVQLD
jgi:very-short-patch-repair endonuclease